MDLLCPIFDRKFVNKKIQLSLTSCFTNLSKENLPVGGFKSLQQDITRSVKQVYMRMESLYALYKNLKL
jgi:hypothetical protein